MPNPDFNAQVSQGYSKKGGAKPPKQRKGVAGSERGPAHKDDPIAWTKVSASKVGFNRAAKFPTVKVSVVSQGGEF